jgi:hypothetical protein
MSGWSTIVVVALSPDPAPDQGVNERLYVIFPVHLPQGYDKFLLRNGQALLGGDAGGARLSEPW